MAHALEALWPADAPISGLVVTRYGHVPSQSQCTTRRINIVEASHPVPDEMSLGAASTMLEMVRCLSADDLVICLMSGGASALLTLPVDGLALPEKQRLSRELLACGAPISEINCVRKHLSRIKGGRLALACAPARVVTLAISDVPSDTPCVIGSGPTVPDATTCSDAVEILHRYGIELPPAVLRALEHGDFESPKLGHAAFAEHSLGLIATPHQSLVAAALVARKAGVATHILSSEIEGEAREVGKVHAAIARGVARDGEPFKRPCLILSGGETTVTIKKQPEGVPRGRGGRAGEFCLGLAIALQSQHNVWALAADTDGIDGSEENAGAFVTPDTLLRASKQGLRPAVHLDRNDSYGFFQLLGDLLVTGPTHTNVNDFRALLVL